MGLTARALAERGEPRNPERLAADVLAAPELTLRLQTIPLQ